MWGVLPTAAILKEFPQVPVKNCARDLQKPEDAQAWLAEFRTSGELCGIIPDRRRKKGGVAVKRWITDRRWEEGGRSEVGPRCNLTGPVPTSAPAAVLWGWRGGADTLLPNYPVITDTLERWMSF